MAISSHDISIGPVPRTRRRLRLPPASVCVSAAIVAVFTLCALVPAIAPADPERIVGQDSFLGRSADHLLGTDQLGRDVFSRVIDGARSALLGPLILATSTVAISAGLALLAGYRKGWVDSLIGRIVDVLYSVPPIVVAIVIVGVVDGGYWMAIGVLLVFGLPPNIRFLRAAVMERTELPYVEAAKTLGVRPLRIALFHILPDIRPFLVAAFFLQFTYGLVDLSSLSFLGLGVRPGSPDWGRMLSENRAALASNVWAAAGPGIALVSVAVATNLIGDWIYARHEQAARAR